MKKQLSLLLIVLGMSANVALAGGITQLAENMEGGEALIAQIRTVLAQDPVYHAQLTGYASSTGGGVVYVTKDLTSDPRETETYEEGKSNVKVNGTNLAMRGVTDFPVYIAAWAQPHPGYYFVGWSYSDGGTDLASIQVPNPSYDSEDPESEEYLTFPEEEYVNAYDVATAENETIDYVVYATFEPYRLTSYTVEGNTTTTSRVSNLTVTCTIDRAGAELTDFESFTIKDPSAGTWEPGSATINGQELSVPVTFTADDDKAGDFSAVLEVKTYAGIAMNVPLRTRTVVLSDVQAIRYSKNKDKLGEGTLDEMIAAADPTDVIKLNGDYNGQVDATKSFTLDLNGYNITHEYTTPRTEEFDNAAIAEAALLVRAEATVTIAYSPYGGEIIAGPFNDAADVFGKLILNGGTLSGFFGVGSVGIVEQNGATINGSQYSSCAIASMGKVTITDGKMNAMVGSKGVGSELIINGGVIDNTVIESPMSGTPGYGVQIGGGVCRINKGTIIGRTHGVQNTEDGGEISIEKLAVIKCGNDYRALDCQIGTITVNNGKFTDPSKLYQGSITFNAGYFQTNTSNVTEVLGKQVWRNTSGAEYREGYNFFAGSAEDAQAAGVSVCHIGGTSYSSLEDALAYANNTSENVTIIIDNDYTLPAGYYTLPANAAILIPYYDEQGSMTPIVDRINKVDAPKLLKPFKWRCLTLADGVNLDVFGTIEVSGRQYSNGNLHSGDVYGAYGQLHLNKGSKIVLQNGSILRAWGYVTSGAGLEESGEIDVRRGATVYELFQMGDWTNPVQAAMGLLSGDEVFPLNTYFIQNIEAPAKYHPGSHLISATTVCEAAMGMTVMMSADDIQIIGESRMENPDVAMFLMDEKADAENTWVRKWYDSRTDQQVYDINSGAHIGQLVIPLVSSPLFPDMGKLIPEGAPGILGNALSSAGDIPESIIMNSGQYNLPITNNFKLHLLSGRLDFTQNTELLPGSELEVDKEAKVTILKSAGQNSRSLYIFDWRDWETWAEGAYARRVQYSPSFDGQPDVRPVDDIEAIGSAKVNVHGTFDTEDGFVFTSEHGGNIFSTVEDAGTFIITMPLTGEDGYDPDYAGEAEDYTVNVSQKSGSATFKPVWLKNEGEDDYTHAGALGELDDVFCYMNFDGTGGKWKKLVFEECFVKDESDVYYAKPQEYVALANGMTPNSDHTYSDAAGAGRLFILIVGEGTDCQWWEVEAKDNYFHCIHPENDTYYEWDDVRNEWKEKKFTITWKNWDGSIITTYSVPYGTQAEWLSTNPTRPANLDYTYDFTGWSPALGKVTSDVTYTATYEAKQIKYTITFVKDGGVEIERHLLARDEVPVCENVPTRTGYILQWKPGIEPVVGNQTYVATWLPEPPETYTITFKNYDGTQLDQQQVTAGDTPEYAGGVAPTKDPTSEYEYTFNGWKPALAEATTNATYVAQFSETARTYEIKFYDENGSGVLKSENLEWGATPTPPAVSKTKTGYTYTYVWQNKDDATKAIESVKGAANYKPVFTETPNKYTVTLQCNVDGACTFTGAGIYEYNTSVTPTVTIKNPTAYEFVEESWKEETTHSFGERQVTGDITLSAMVKAKNVVLADLELGIDDAETVSSATNYEDVIITSDGLARSSQIINANNITLYGNADFVLQQTIEAGKWYSIAVPWRVNANGGVYLGDAATPATLGPDFEVIYYDGSVRATQGPGAHCWVYMKNLGSSQKVLEPGRAYMIYLKKNNVSKITFRKTAKADLLTTSTSVNSYPETTNNEGKDANWNAIANPALYHAYINAGSDEAKAQRYLADEERYDWFNLNAHQLVVGEPIYVQAPSDKSVVANGASYAPRRATTEQTTYDVNITAAGASKYADHLSVQINDDKEADKYTIGQDLVKFGVSSKVAQMWINRYDAKLCANTMVSGEESTFFPMSVYAPKAGDYTIAIEREVAAEEYALYLTYNGEAIWNLSEGAYVANLPKGTDANYGLRISVRKAPMTPTAIDEAIVDAQGETRKVLINNQVFIIRGDKVYSINGQLVK